MKKPSEIFEGENSSLKKTFDSLQPQQMVKAGYPYCYKENGVPRHCETCIKYYKLSVNKK